MISYSRLGRVGRLGNQLFQVAFVTHFASKYNIPYTLPVWDYAGHFNHFFNFNEELKNVSFDITIKEPSLQYNEDYFRSLLPQMHSKKVNIHTGYFQSCNYFSKAHALTIFKPWKGPAIKTNFNKSIAISVRRGDFVKHSLFNNIEAGNYRHLLSAFKNFKVFVFTDDYRYCRNEFPGSQYEFFDGATDIEQLLLMRQFRYFILSNSTFSYWGPMLNEKPERVLYPLYMFPDLDRCALYNEQYWPKDKAYIPYVNEINK
jgi:hypothetical protein